MQLPSNPNRDIDYTDVSLHRIYLAGGCFWGTQAYLSRLVGVAHTECGYANGKTEHPTYEEVCLNHTGHAEAVCVDYDPCTLPLESLLLEYFKTINPTSRNWQGGDVGPQYRTGIYYNRAEDLDTIRSVIGKVQQRYEQTIATEVEPLQNYYPAEEYHQNYLEKNPNGYCHVDLTQLPERGVAK